MSSKPDNIFDAEKLLAEAPELGQHFDPKLFEEPKYVGERGPLNRVPDEVRTYDDGDAEGSAHSPIRSLKNAEGEILLAVRQRVAIGELLAELEAGKPTLKTIKEILMPFSSYGKRLEGLSVDLQDSADVNRLATHLETFLMDEKHKPSDTPELFRHLYILADIFGVSKSVLTAKFAELMLQIVRDERDPAKVNELLFVLDHTPAGCKAYFKDNRNEEVVSLQKSLIGEKVRLLNMEQPENSAGEDETMGEVGLGDEVEPTLRGNTRIGGEMLHPSPLTRVAEGEAYEPFNWSGGISELLIRLGTIPTLRNKAFEEDPYAKIITTLKEMTQGGK